MKRISGFLMILACGVFTATAKPLRTNVISMETEKITSAYRAWLDEKPRKTAVRFMRTEELPASLRELGYRSAIVETGLIILISTEDGASVSEGIAIVTDGVDKSDLLKNSGWQIRDSDHGTIKYLKRSETPSGTQPLSPGHEPNLRRVAY